MFERLGMLLGGTLILGATLSCDSSTPNGDCTGKEAAATVTATNSNTFSPGDVTIAAGQSVCWQNGSTTTHTVTSDGGNNFNGALGGAGTFLHSFSTPGHFTYHCTIHEGMAGSVTVQ